MGDRPTFRFRLPWLSAITAPRPGEPIRPSAQTRAAAQPTTAIPIQRPPFRPPGIAPTLIPSPQTQAPPKTKPQSPSPPRAATEFQVTSQPTSPSRETTQTRAASLPPSPFRGTTESQVTSQQASPALATTQPQAVSAAPPSPSHGATDSQVTSEQASPSRATIQTRASSVPPSPSLGTTETQVSSQQASPERGTTQARDASVEPPSPSLGATNSQKTSQQASPTRATTQSTVTSQSQSPPHATTQSTAASVPPSPSRTATQPQPTKQTTPQPQSPSRLTSRSAGQASSQPSSPSHSATQAQPTAEAVSQRPSPPKKLQPTTKEASQLLPSSTQPLSSASQLQGSEPVVSMELPQKPQPKIESTPDAIIKSKEQSPIKTITQPDEVAAQQLEPSGLVKSIPPTSLAAPKQLAALRNSKETKGEEVAEELSREEKTKDLAHEDPMQKTSTKLLAAAPDSGTQTREVLSTAFQTEKRKQEKQDFFEGKGKVATASSDEKQIKTGTSTCPEDRNILSKPHQKPVLPNMERAPLQKEIKEDISKFVNKLVAGQQNQPLGQKSVSVITMTGENKGVSMNLGSESGKKDGSVHIHRGYKTNPDESPEATTDGEESFKGRRTKDPITKEASKKAYINSNTQSINNSILFDSCVNERNPGVQLVFYHNLSEPTAKPESLETRKAEFNITPAEKLTYEPTLRRRCLRGLFMEPSDSDPDNPEKPRRHGCRYNCGEKSKDKEIGVL